LNIKATVPLPRSARNTTANFVIRPILAEVFFIAAIRQGKVMIPTMPLPAALHAGTCGKLSLPSGGICFQKYDNKQVRKMLVGQGG
jgi:hypothetical protein